MKSWVKKNGKWIKREIYKKRRKKKRKFKTYKEYLKSQQWDSRRREKLKRAGYKCEKCTTTKNLHVHHKTYKRIFKEKMSDLIVLCSICHGLYHKKFTEEEIQLMILEMQKKEGYVNT